MFEKPSHLRSTIHISAQRPPGIRQNDAICGRAWRTHPKLTGDEKNEVLSVQSSRTAGFNRDLLLVAGRMMFDDRMETKVYREYLRIEMTR